MEINSVVEYDDKYLKVVEDKDCEGCYFNPTDLSDDHGECDAPFPYYCCYPDSRKDDKFVKYIEVKYPKVGQVYNYKGVLLKYIHSDSNCKGCYFYEPDDGVVCAAKGFFSCSMGTIFTRVDGKQGDVKQGDVKEDVVKEGYQTLYNVLFDALEQSQSGKGVERHAADNNFEDQVICVVQRLLFKHPFGYQAGQAIKKLIEAGRLYDLERPDEAYAEVCGAINYAAAMAHLIKENNGGN
jgi:hypothetical protein